MYDSLGDRQKDYEQAFDHQIIRRTPIIVRCDGRSFSRLCRKLKRPYSPRMQDAMIETMFYVVTEMAGCCFAYTQSDEITFVLRNDQSLDSEPWYGNRIQKIASVTASLATLGFNKNKEDLDLIGDAVFDARVFGMPTVGEVCNNLIWRQKDCSRNAISTAAQTVLTAKFGKKSALKMLHGVGSAGKLDMMLEECGIDFKEEYPASYRMGIAAYKVPVIVTSEHGNETRKKWKINGDLPDFVQEREFLYNIIYNGSDVFRADNIITDDNDMV